MPQLECIIKRQSGHSLTIVKFWQGSAFYLFIYFILFIYLITEVGLLSQQLHRE